MYCAVPQKGTSKLNAGQIALKVQARQVLLQAFSGPLLDTRTLASLVMDNNKAKLRDPSDPAFDGFRRFEDPLSLSDHVRNVLLMPLIVVRLLVLLVTTLLCWLVFLTFGPRMHPVDRTADVTTLPKWRAKVVHHVGTATARTVLFGLGFHKVVVEEEDGYNAEEASKATLVSNHVSMVDIPVMVALMNPGFVSKASLSKVPVVARIAAVGGCLFVDRLAQGAGSVTSKVGERQAALAEGKGHRLVVFPEGTTTNGIGLLPFKTGAFVAGLPVAPMLLRYPYKKFSPAYDSIEAKELILGLCTQWYNRVVVRKLKVYYPSEEEKKDPKLYAENVRDLLRREGNLVLTISTYLDKLEYHKIKSRTPTPLSTVETIVKKYQ
eukprot:Plantae.Rhodophyta-Rhodochaete_pulchella.ctg1352.p2 GENE.Plantae.Rhodophyta-Rhodochaete_pulchella.ctg1352~~Plantae.Rhodophyta-Rhodochaete_pulchella.ctg1352.p2  ORF type:complete len:379 (+),score=58.67 Plantae.Rhodophyta-Rhodochaete_pulchella.ctg1352:1159-2295(+)